jgi:hypothetical protein
MDGFQDMALLIYGQALNRLVGFLVIPELSKQQRN